MNVRYDDVVHARDDSLPGSVNPDSPLCGDSMIPACAPELTSDDVTCWQCGAILA